MNARQLEKKAASRTMRSVADKSMAAIRYLRSNPMMVIRGLRSNLRLEIFNIKNQKAAAAIKRVIHEGLSYKTLDGLCDLAQVAINNEKRGMEGITIEAGCALGVLP